MTAEPIDPAAEPPEPINLRKLRSVPPPPADDMLEGVVLPVDPPPDGHVLSWHDKAMRQVKRADIVAPWLRRRETRHEVVRYEGTHVMHSIGYHGGRVLCGFYFGRALKRTPRGMWLTGRAWRRWQFDAEGKPLRDAAVLAGDHAAYLKLVGLKHARMKARAWGTGGGAVTLGGAGIYVHWFAPWYGQPLALTGAVMVLGKVGSPKDEPLIGRAVIKREAPRLTSDAITRALCSLGIGELNKAVARDPGAIEFPSHIQRDGPGWRAEIELPFGVPASAVIEKREGLAAGLKRPLLCVWPECDSDVHPGRLVLWVADKTLAATKAAPWPLLKAGKADLFRPIPFGTDQRGRPVSITLMFATMVVGAIPRVGKTFAVRLLLLAAALDVRAAIYAFDLKGTGDFSPLELVAHRYRSGFGDDDISYLLDCLKELHRELDRRAKVIRRVTKDPKTRHLCPENKVTPELAGDRSLGLHPIVLALDECQMAYVHPEFGAGIQSVVEDLVRLGPALGIIVINATQRPNAAALPPAISAQAVLRFALKVKDQVSNDMILGTSSYKNGLRATVFSRKDLGIGYLLGEEDEAQIVRTHYVDGPAAGRITARARAAREAAGTLSGYALGQEPEVEERESYDLLADVLACVRSTEKAVHSRSLLPALAELNADVYTGWDETTLAKNLKSVGVETGQQKIEGVNLKGVRVDDVRAAIKAREGGDE